MDISDDELEEYGITKEMGKKVESIEVAYCLKIDKNTTGDELNKLAKKMYKEIFEVTEGVEIWDYNTIVRVFDDIRNGNV